MNWYKLSKKAHTPMPKRKLGKTGYDVGLFSLGGQGSLETQGDDDNCIKIIQRAYELGVNYFDTSPIYGPSEDFYGKTLKGFRKKIFLASKSAERTRDGAMRDIEKSLKRLNTDYLDLWQIHALKSMKEINEITNRTGALEAFIQMKEEGVVKNLGFTGHENPKILVEMMKRFNFDTVLCPVNACDKNMNPSFINTVVKEANKREMGIIGMKVFSQGFIFHPKGITTTWEPVSYSLSQPISTIIVGCNSVAQLEENISIAKSFEPMSNPQQKELEEQTVKYKNRASFFRSQYGGYDSRDKLDKPYIIENFK